MRPRYNANDVENTEHSLCELLPHVCTPMRVKTTPILLGRMLNTQKC